MEVSGSFTCPVCHRKFHSKAVFDKHLLLHAKGKGHECEICHFLFSYKSHLKVHMLTHSDTRTLKCDFCDYIAKTRSNLRNHLVFKHRNTMLLCKKCSKSYVPSSNISHKCESKLDESLYLIPKDDLITLREVLDVLYVISAKDHLSEDNNPTSDEDSVNLTHNWQSCARWSCIVECKICRKGFLHEESFNEHVTEHLLSFRQKDFMDKLMEFYITPLYNSALDQSDEPFDGTHTFESLDATEL